MECLECVRLEKYDGEIIEGFGTKKLYLIGCGIVRIGKVQGLKYLNMKSCDAIRKLDWIGKVSGELKEVCIVNCEGLRDIEGLSWGYLEDCRIYDCEVKNMNAIGEMRGLKNLILCGCSVVEDMAWLGGLGKLEGVEIVDCLNVKKFVLSSMALKYIEIEGCADAVISIDAANLETLYIDGGFCEIVTPLRCVRDAYLARGYVGDLGKFGFRDLVEIMVKNCKVSGWISLRECVGLKSISVDEANAEVNLSELGGVNLEELIVRARCVGKWGLRNMKKMRKLLLDYGGGNFDLSLLSGMRELENVTLVGNCVWNFDGMMRGMWMEKLKRFECGSWRHVGVQYLVDLRKRGVVVIESMGE